MITIVVINHNYGRFLSAAIDSALAQNMGVDRVIVVDDGSTDNSLEIIASYGDRIVPVLKQAGGHVSAVNAGFMHATGDLCIFLDADDLLYKNCAELVLKNWTFGDSKLQFRLNTIDRDGIDQAMPFPDIGPSLTPKKIRCLSFESGWYPWTVSSGNAFHRRYLETLLPIDEDRIYRSPDGYLSKLAPLYGNVRSLNEILGAYRVHGENAWAQTGSAWTVNVVLRWLQFEKILEDAFLESAQSVDIFVKNPLRQSLQKLEYTLLARRFHEETFSFISSSRLKLFADGVFACFRPQPYSVLGKILWLIWFLLLCFGPLFVVKLILRRTRGQLGRTKGVRAIIRMTKQ